MGWWPIFLHRLEVVDDAFGIGLLFIDDSLEHIELLVDLLSYLINQGLLVENALLHILAFL